MQNQSQKIAVKVTFIGGIFDFFLGVFKIIIGKVYYSNALVVDGIHSMSDVVTDIFVIIMSKISHDNPDDDHPYGHGRFETLGTIIIGISLILVAFYFAKDGIEKFLTNESFERPGSLTILMAFISIIIKEGLYHYTMRAAKKIDSKLLMANAWHSRSDAFSSILVLIGVGLSYYGVMQADIIMSIILSGFIGKIGWDFIWSSLKELVDTAVDEKTYQEIMTVISNIDGVKGVHNLRSRFLNDEIFIDVNIEVSQRITVSEGHEIATWVGHTLTQKFKKIKDVTVHTDIEDDRQIHNYTNVHKKLDLPLRTEVLTDISRVLTVEELSKIKEFNLHYLGEKIDIDCLILSPLDSESCRQRIKELQYIKNVNFYLNQTNV